MASSKILYRLKSVSSMSETANFDVRLEVSKCFCKSQGLVSTDCGGKGGKIDDAAYENAAKALGVEVAALKAIGKQETGGGAFYKNKQG